MTCDAQSLRSHCGSLRLLKVLMNITYEWIGLNFGKNAWNDSLLDFLFPKEKKRITLGKEIKTGQQDARTRWRKKWFLIDLMQMQILLKQKSFHKNTTDVCGVHRYFADRALVADCHVHTAVDDWFQGFQTLISYVINSNGWLVFSLLVIRNKVICFSLTGDKVKRLWLRDMWGGDPRGWKTRRTMGTFFTLSNSVPHESEIIQGYQVIK